MSIDSTRVTAWTAVHDPATSGAELAAIASAHPEFAAAIAAHPNSYPELATWARSVTGAGSAASDSLPEPHPHAGRAEAPLVALSPNQRLGRAIWAVVFALVVGVPLLADVVLRLTRSSTGGDGDGAYTFWLYGMQPLSPSQLLMIVVHALAVVAAALCTRSVARRVGSIALVVAAWLVTFGLSMLGWEWWWPLWWVLWGPTAQLSVTVWASLLFLGWAVSRPLRGAGYAALPIVTVLPILLEMFVWEPVRAWAWNGGDVQADLVYVLTLLVGTVVIPAAGLLLARMWTAGAERRASERSRTRRSQVTAAAGPAYAGGIPAAERTNTLAILSLVFAFVFSILGVVFGHVALGQISRTGEQGRGLAIAGLIVGYLGIVAGVVLVISQIMLFSSLSSYYG